MNFFEKIWNFVKPFKEPISDMGIDIIIDQARKAIFKLIDQSGSQVNKVESKNWINEKLKEIQEKLDKWI